MPATYDLIYSGGPLTNDSTNVYFNQIPQTYTDLRVVITAMKSSTTSTNVNMRFNSNLSSLHSYVIMYSEGTQVTYAYGLSTNQIEVATATLANSGDILVSYIDIFNYARTDVNKTCTIFASYPRASVTGVVNAVSGLYRSNSAITALEFLDTSGRNFGAGTYFQLYGILRA